MITVKDILKMLEKDFVAFKKERANCLDHISWCKANAILDYIRRLINDIKIQDVPLNDALSDTEMKHAL